MSDLLPVHPAHRRMMDFLARRMRAPWWSVPLGYIALVLQWLEDHTDEYARVALAVVVVGSLASPAVVPFAARGMSAPAHREGAAFAVVRRHTTPFIVSQGPDVPDDRADLHVHDQGGRSVAANMATQPGVPAAGSEVDLPSEVVSSAATRRRPGVFYGANGDGG